MAQGVLVSSFFSLRTSYLVLLDKTVLYMLLLLSVLLAWFQSSTAVVPSFPFYSLIQRTTSLSRYSVHASQVYGTEVDLTMGWAGSSFTRLVSWIRPGLQLFLRPSLVLAFSSIIIS